ncbi:hypothetical protein MYAM1_000542 [Malassezia yamatoensis]|uniref:Uncharacterized protein n=1 Tax=Malassezia yamatoensis TaxID=253288 RepID=A0AAJ5YUH4_9BASI|nr:hypothetical protein MYAM1_000542 [Malassezia yamatoensis]
MAREEHGSCKLAELTQFHCQLLQNRIVCQPVERIFRICPGRPAVEVTHLVEYNAQMQPLLPDALPQYTHLNQKGRRQE